MSIEILGQNMFVSVRASILDTSWCELWRDSNNGWLNDAGIMILHE